MQTLIIRKWKRPAKGRKRELPGAAPYPWIIARRERNMRKISKRIAAAALAAALIPALLAGCSAPRAAKKYYTVVASFYPVYISALNIAGGVDGVRVVNMTRPTTGCLHDYQITSGDMQTIESADVFVINGAGMESFLTRVTKQMPKLATVNASEGIELIRGSDGEYNAHVWVSVSDDIKEVENIAAGLQKNDPAHARQYRQNAEKYIAKLTALRSDMHAALDGVKNRRIITFHEAFPYFASEFGLETAAVIERDPGAEPTPKQLAQVIDTVKSTGCRALFAEPQYSQAAARAISAETGAKIYYLDPAVSGPDRADAYIDIMRNNLKVLKEALD
jgi:zinc transport system substrate-binding protein